MISTALILTMVVLVWAWGIAAPFILVAAIILASFALAAANASPRPPEMRLGLAARLRLWGGELLAAWWVMLVSMPLRLVGRDAAGTRVETPPILLIHGYQNNAGALWTLWRALRAAGFRTHSIDLEPVHADLDGYAARIDERIAQIRAATGAERVILVCHSMGGLVARAYLRRFGGAAVAKVITLGTPHHGTVHAKTAAGRNGRQMEPGSAWLAELARSEAGAWPCPFVSIYTHDDNIVAPQLSARLEGARNVALNGIGHISLPMSARVAALVIEELARDPLRSFAPPSPSTARADGA